MAEEEEFGEEALEDEHDDAVRSTGSSMIEAWGYNREDQELEVSFRNGHTQTYPCDPETWEEAKLTPSPGRFMWANFLA